MSFYSEQLAKLKKELTIILHKKGKGLTTNQKIMHRFIYGKTSKAEFNIAGQKVTLHIGDDKKGFRHILEGHYASNDLEAIDILNIIDIFKEGIKLNEEGVSNVYLDVYMRLKRQKEHRLILKKVEDDSWVVTFYRKI